MLLYHFVRLCLLGTAIAALAAPAAPSEEGSHRGPVIAAYVQRGSTRLPIFQVDHLHKGDKLLVKTDKSEKDEGSWLMVLATVSPTGNKVDAHTFDLTEHVDEAEIDITSEDQVPILVLAPQVRTMFGLHTSFSQSANLIIDAIKADPQRFIDLQKIDQINHAIAVLKAVLDNGVQSPKPEQAIEEARAVAAKFGVKTIDPSCFKDNTVNTKCVAANIVYSKDLTVPSSDDMWQSSGPNASAAKIPTDIFDSLKIVTEASAYLVNKYGDNYDFAPSSGQRLENSDSIQLFTSARFKTGYVKTAYAYVPSWFSGKRPEITIAGKAPSCLTKGEVSVNIVGALPLTNYWHDWTLSLHEPGAPSATIQTKAVDFNPNKGVFTFDEKKLAAELPAKNMLLEAKLTGRFGLTEVNVPAFKVILPSTEHLPEHIVGQDSLIAGEQAKLHVASPEGNACVEQMQLLVNDKPIATSQAESGSELNVDLSKVEPGPAVLEVHQYGVGKREIPVSIKKHKAHVQRLVHLDLETDITAYGDNLDRIDAIQAGKETCTASGDTDTQTLPATRTFTCPKSIASNNQFPSKVTIKHVDQEPAPFEVAVTKSPARPHMTVEGVRAALITTLSNKAAQWNLSPDDQLITEDSGLGILMRAFGGYQLGHGTYVLQIKFADDPITEQSPLSAPLMSDRAHNELRTRSPIYFTNAPLPSVVNPIYYRVVVQPSGLAGDWQPLNRSVVSFPQFTAVTCASSSGSYLIHGNQLELIDWVSSDLTKASNRGSSNDRNNSSLLPCDKSLCLSLADMNSTKQVRVKMHWIDDRLFNVNLNDAPVCASPK